MNLTPEMILSLRTDVKPYLTEKRYRHTLAVEKEAEHLSRLMLTDKCDGEENVLKIRAAALLHDITKKEDFEKQLQYCALFGIIANDNLLESPKLFHAVTASELIKRDFKAFDDPVITGCVRWHTTGRFGMTLSEAIVYLADYIEETRTFPDCVKLREFFYEGVFYEGIGKNRSELQMHFIRTMILSFDYTIKALCREGSPIDADTVSARNYFIGLLNGNSRNFFGELDK